MPKKLCAFDLLNYFIDGNRTIDLFDTINGEPWDTKQTNDIAIANILTLRDLARERSHSQIRYWLEIASHFSAMAFVLGTFSGLALLAFGISPTTSFSIAAVVGAAGGYGRAELSLSVGRIIKPFNADQILLIKQLEEEAVLVLSEISRCEKAQIPLDYLSTSRINGRFKQAAKDTLDTVTNIPTVLSTMISDYVYTKAVPITEADEKFETKLAETETLAKIIESLSNEIDSNAVCYFGCFFGRRNINAAHFAEDIRNRSWDKKSLLQHLVINRDREDLPPKVNNVIQKYIEEINGSFALDAPRPSLRSA